MEAQLIKKKNHWNQCYYANVMINELWAIIAALMTCDDVTEDAEQMQETEERSRDERRGEMETRALAWKQVSIHDIYAIYCMLCLLNGTQFRVP